MYAFTLLIIIYSNRIYNTDYGIQYILQVIIPRDDHREGQRTSTETEKRFPLEEKK